MSRPAVPLSLWSLREIHGRKLEGIAPTGKSVYVDGQLLSRIVDGKFIEEWVHRAEKVRSGASAHQYVPGQRLVERRQQLSDRVAYFARFPASGGCTR